MLDSDNRGYINSNEFIWIIFGLIENGLESLQIQKQKNYILHRFASVFDKITINNNNDCNKSNNNNKSDVFLLKLNFTTKKSLSEIFASSQALMKSLDDREKDSCKKVQIFDEMIDRLIETYGIMSKKFSKGAMIITQYRFGSNIASATKNRFGFRDENLLPWIKANFEYNSPRLKQTMKGNAKVSTKVGWVGEEFCCGFLIKSLNEERVGDLGWNDPVSKIFVFVNVVSKMRCLR